MSSKYVHTVSMYDAASYNIESGSSTRDSNTTPDVIEEYATYGGLSGFYTFAVRALYIKYFLDKNGPVYNTVPDNNEAFVSIRKVYNFFKTKWLYGVCTILLIALTTVSTILATKPDDCSNATTTTTIGTTKMTTASPTHDYTETRGSIKKPYRPFSTTTNKIMTTKIKTTVGSITTPLEVQSTPITTRPAATAVGTITPETIDVVFSVKLSVEFGSMTENDKTKFADDLKSLMAASLAIMNPFEGGTVEITVTFEIITKRRRRNLEYEAVVTVTYVAPATEKSGQVSATATSMTYLEQYNELDLSSVASSVGDVAKATMSSGDFVNLVDQHDLASLQPTIRGETSSITTTISTKTNTPALTTYWNWR